MTYYSLEKIFETLYCSSMQLYMPMPREKPRSIFDFLLVQGLLSHSILNCWHINQLPLHEYAISTYVATHASRIYSAVVERKLFARIIRDNSQFPLSVSCRFREETIGTRISRGKNGGPGSFKVKYLRFERRNHGHRGCIIRPAWRTV